MPRVSIPIWRRSQLSTVAVKRETVHNVSLALRIFFIVMHCYIAVPCVARPDPLTVLDQGAWPPTPFVGAVALPMGLELREAVGVVRDAARRRRITKEILQNSSTEHLGASVNLVLHLPKTGGTSICAAMRRAHAAGLHSHVAIPSSNGCWGADDGPEWANMDHSCSREHTCGSRLQKGPSIGLIERYMDTQDMDTDPTSRRVLLCDGVTYTLMLRDPVARAVSHATHLTSLGVLLHHNRKLLGDWVLATRPREVQQFLDTLDRLQARSQASRELIAATVTNQPYSAALELDCYILNAITSNYLARMLLGAQLGPEPLIVSSAKLTPARVYDALWMMGQFDHVIFSDSLGPDTLHALGIKLPARAPHRNSFAKARVYRKLTSSAYQGWLRRRNEVDSFLVHMANVTAKEWHPRHRQT